MFTFLCEPSLPHFPHFPTSLSLLFFIATPPSRHTLSSFLHRGTTIAPHCLFFSSSRHHHGGTTIAPPPWRHHHRAMHHHRDSISPHRHAPVDSFFTKPFLQLKEPGTYGIRYLGAIQFSSRVPKVWSC
ncbi:uncharacterized protein LOC114397333 [Glycine soja]|uniref:uncharacterized protein LOC114397333 n=1 Tax=Glycine soja TaxID=3848 RepID=UPI00103EC913|nr:uncharacterized protein LOC114397333 [Glycine soja]